MSSPTPEGSTPPPAPVRLRRGQLVTFQRADQVLGGEYEDQGVIVAVGGDGEPITVRPLQPHSVQIDPGKATPATADDVTPG